ncbi:MAG: ABC-2 type transport system ATP-binding protein [Acidimicrobiales bacterium]|jgi:ABC-2 type transport system ATP-binding protein
MKYAIETTGLNKLFGRVHAVRDLELRVETGEIFGFLGPNGSGKSTTIRLILDELRANSGLISVLGLDSHVDVTEVHQRTGYLPGELVVPDHMTGHEFFGFLCRLRGVTDTAVQDQLVERFDLDPTRRLGELSTGNKQKVGLVQAFMHRPELVLLDEPTTGLDPLVQHDFHEMLRQCKAEGMTVLLSSHTLSEVDRVADRVGILRSGMLVAVDHVSVLKGQVRRHIEIEFERPPRLEALAACPGVTDLSLLDNLASFTTEGPLDSILRCALGVGTILSISTPEPDLEEVFLEFYRRREGDNK